MGRGRSTLTRRPGYVKPRTSNCHQCIMGSEQNAYFFFGFAAGFAAGFAPPPCRIAVISFFAPSPPNDPPSSQPRTMKLAALRKGSGQSASVAASLAQSSLDARAGKPDARAHSPSIVTA